MTVHPTVPILVAASEMAAVTATVLNCTQLYSTIPVFVPVTALVTVLVTATVFVLVSVPYS